MEILILIAIANGMFWGLFLNSPIHPKLNFKPFNCPNCMGWWFSIIMVYIQLNNIILAISAGMITYYLVSLIKKLTNKI